MKCGWPSSTGRPTLVPRIPVKIYNPAKTVTDCFKYRNKIGLDVALEALREVIRERRCTIDELWKYAKICRVTKTMRPYMEATDIQLKRPRVKTFPTESMKESGKKA